MNIRSGHAENMLTPSFIPENVEFFIKKKRIHLC